MDQAHDNIEKMKVRAPMDGVIAVDKNMSTEFFFDGMSLPDYHVGDQTNPGATIARILDPSDMELVAKLHERERNNVEVGQAVEIELDALLGMKFAGTVKTIGTMAPGNFWENEHGGHFEVTIQLPRPDARLRSGLTAQVVIAGDLRKDALTVPKQAVFMGNGKHVVYVKNGSGFEAREVKVLAETESRTAIEGLRAGTDIAFVNPTEQKKSGPTEAGGPVVEGGR
jgi:multidrug efflux pump subunit AcrA (membrane-fusion protein)